MRALATLVVLLSFSLTGCNDGPDTDPCVKFEEMLNGDSKYDDLGIREWQKQNEQAYEDCMKQNEEIP